jgi:hypothetical protein
MSSNTFINTVTFEYPRHQGDVRLVHPEIGDEFVLPEGSPFVEVEDTPVPEAGVDEVLTEAMPVLTGGKWVRQFSVRAMTQQELDDRQAQLAAMYPPVLPNQDNSNPGSEPDVIG